MPYYLPFASLAAVLLTGAACTADPAAPANAASPAIVVPPGPVTPPGPPPANPESAYTPLPPPPTKLPDGRAMPEDLAVWLTRAWRCRSAVEYDRIVQPPPGDLSTGEKCIGVDEERDRLLRKHRADKVIVKFLDEYPSGTFLDRIRE